MAFRVQQDAEATRFFQNGVPTQLASIESIGAGIDFNVGTTTEVSVRSTGTDCLESKVHNAQHFRTSPAGALVCTNNGKKVSLKCFTMFSSFGFRLPAACATANDKMLKISVSDEQDVVYGVDFGDLSDISIPSSAAPSQTDEYMIQYDQSDTFPSWVRAVGTARLSYPPSVSLTQIYFRGNNNVVQWNGAVTTTTGCIYRDGSAIKTTVAGRFAFMVDISAYPTSANGEKNFWVVVLEGGTQIHSTMSCMSNQDVGSVATARTQTVFNVIVEMQVGTAYTICVNGSQSNGYVDLTYCRWNVFAV